MSYLPSLMLALLTLPEIAIIVFLVGQIKGAQYLREQRNAVFVGKILAIVKTLSATRKI